MDKLLRQQPELERRLANCNTLLTDLDGTLYPAGTANLGLVLNDLTSAMQIVPCTTRSWNEMLGTAIPGRLSLAKSGIGIFEAGLIVRKAGKNSVMCEEKELEKVSQLKNILRRKIPFIGPRKFGNNYELINDLRVPIPFGWLQSTVGDKFVTERCVPIAVPNYPNQYSLVIWPSGSAGSTPPERNFYQVCFFLDGMKAANPALFENMDILVGDESVIVRPKDRNGNAITKLTGLNVLIKSNELNPATSLFLGDDDNLDLPVAEFIRAAGGVVIVPKNAGEKMKKIADFVAPGFAGEAMLPVLLAFNQIKNGTY